jgi:peptide/nickel transport system substrate-binding protein
MKRIDCPFLARNNSFLAFVALCALGVAASGAGASTRPQRGGTLRVQMSERIPTIDPRQWLPGVAWSSAAERVDSLVFDRLVRLDEHGTLQPALATSWQHDPQSNRWQFRLRAGVKFSDGTPLTPPIVALALQQLLGVTYDVSANSDSVIIQTERPLPGLVMELSSGRYFIFRVADDNSVFGTGPFRVAEWPTTPTSPTVVLAANESCWAGRPFVDKIELTMGVDFPQQANAISFGQADVVELPASSVRRAAQRGVRTSSSEPVELFALVLDPAHPALSNAHVRQAVSLAIDRSSIADVILQKQGIAAGSLLPNWISGYAHLFPPVFDLALAKELLADSRHERSSPAPLVLAYDSGDAEARGVADRVAVNLREAGIMVQVSGQPADGKAKLPAADSRLVRHRVAGPNPAAALAEMLHALGEPDANPETLEQVYEAERSPIGAFRVIPLVHVSETFGLGLPVRDWMAPRWGGWDLADVWLGPAAGAEGNAP